MTTSTDRPIIGEIRRGQQLGRTRDARYIWQACEDCGHQRWVRLNHGSPATKRCNPCARKHNSNKAWWL